MRISAAQRDQLIAHAVESAPNECCGYLRLRDGVVEEVFRSENLRESPYGYELDGRSLQAANALDDAGYGVAIYHSHPRTPAEPSQTDLNLAQYPDWTYVIVSPDGPAGDRQVRCWRIIDGRAEEEGIRVD